MKKILLVVLIILATLSMAGWTDPRTNEYHYDKISVPYDIWVDPVTGVQYIVIKEKCGYGYGVGITPRLNADGSLMVGKSVIRKTN